jgi:hypothetical protein
MEYGEPAHDIWRMFPYTKKTPRQTSKRITSVELPGSGLVAGFLCDMEKQKAFLKPSRIDADYLYLKN